MNIWQNKPLLIGGGIVIVVIVMLAAGGGGAKAGTVTYATVPNGQSDAQLAAARDIQIASIQAGAAASANNAQLAMLDRQGQIDLAKAQLNGQLSQYAIDADNAAAARRLDVEAGIQRLQIQSASDTQEYLVAQQGAIAKYTLDQALATTRSNNEFQLEYATNANNSAVMMQSIQAQVVNNQLAVNRDITLGVLSSQSALEAARLGAQRDVALTQIYADRDNTTAAYNAQVAAAGIQAQVYANENAANVAIANLQSRTVADQTAAVISSLGSVKKSSRDEVLQSLITGQPVYSQPSGPSKTAQVIGAIGGVAKTIGSFL